MTGHLHGEEKSNERQADQSWVTRWAALCEEAGVKPLPPAGVETTEPGRCEVETVLPAGEAEMHLAVRLPCSEATQTVPYCMLGCKVTSPPCYTDTENNKAASEYLRRSLPQAPHRTQLSAWAAVTSMVTRAGCGLSRAPAHAASCPSQGLGTPQGTPQLPQQGAG